MPDNVGQQILATDHSVNLHEALGARVKDPLWFLARQWQTGEFTAENGGKPSTIRFESVSDHFQHIVLSDTIRIPITGDEPLDALIEAEDGTTGHAPAWRSTELEYQFLLETEQRNLAATQYNGRNLDWFHFDQQGPTRTRPPSAAPPTTAEMVPTQLYFRGAPHPRWWRFEDSDADFDSAVDHEPNVLTMLLPEFFFIDINNWFVIPAPQRSGTIREITKLSVADSFGIVTELNPFSDSDWNLFAFSDSTGQHTAGPSVLMAPNIALDVVESDLIEDVRFIRDEGANLVWAFERAYQNANGEAVLNADASITASPTAIDPTNTPVYHLSDEPLPAWIPYVPRHLNPTAGLGEQVRLRRGRTVPSATSSNPQYHSVIVGESTYLNEEEIPKTGIRIQRIHRYARGSDGLEHFWVARSRDVGRASGSPSMRFDHTTK
jgi:hypothetical protein